MSCDRRCFDPVSEYYEFSDCAICPGGDGSRPLNKAMQPEIPLDRHHAGFTVHPSELANKDDETAF